MAAVPPPVNSPMIAPIAVSKSERIVLRQEDDAHEDPTERSPDDDTDAETHRRSDRETAKPPSHG